MTKNKLLLETLINLKIDDQEVENIQSANATANNRTGDFRTFYQFIKLFSGLILQNSFIPMPPLLKDIHILIMYTVNIYHFIIKLIKLYRFMYRHFKLA